jgi:hypothetical protein
MNQFRSAKIGSHSANRNQKIANDFSFFFFKVPRTGQECHERESFVTNLGSPRPGTFPLENLPVGIPPLNSLPYGVKLHFIIDLILLLLPVRINNGIAKHKDRRNCFVAWYLNDVQLLLSGNQQKQQKEIRM